MPGFRSTLLWYVLLICPFSALAGRAEEALAPDLFNVVRYFILASPKKTTRVAAVR